MATSESRQREGYRKRGYKPKSDVDGVVPSILITMGLFKYMEQMMFKTAFERRSCHQNLEWTISISLS